MSDTGTLTQPQIRCLEELPDDYEVVTEAEGAPILSGPRGQWLRVTPSGRIVPLVETRQSYLNANG
jgi:hypothetical protein